MITRAWFYYLAGFLILLAPSSLRAEEPQQILWVAGVENAYPRWSADGQSILFQSNRTGTWQIYTMRADGSEQRQITTDSSNNNFPDWSPDNQLIAFASDRDGNEEIYVMRLDGTGLKRLTSDPGRDIHPYFAPDGSSLLFNSNRSDAAGFDVFQINVDGSGLKQLTATADVETCARFSPDGSSILFLNGDRAAMNDEVYLMNADGTNRLNLTKSPSAEGWPCWSHDGQRILFSSDRTGVFSLFSMRRDGSDLRQCSFPRFPYMDARVSVDSKGSRWLFNRQKGDGTIGIYAMPAEKKIPRDEPN